MAATSQWNLYLRNSLRPKQPITFHPTSALANPQNSRFCSEWTLATEEMKCKLKSRREYIEDESFGRNAPSSTASECTNNDKDESSRKNVPSVTAECVAKDCREHNNYEYESLRASAEVSRPRPQEVLWQKGHGNKVHFIGKIALPVQYSPTKSGKLCATTTLQLYDGIRFPLLFFNELAEIAAQHLKTWDLVYVSGCFGLQRRPGEGEKSQTYKVIARTLNFIEKRSAHSIINRDPPFQYEKSQVESSNSAYAASIESLWRAYFRSPLEWQDTRTNKTNPKCPDFKHKYTGALLWIHNRSNPSWVKDSLAVRDSRMKVPEKCG